MSFRTATNITLKTIAAGLLYFALAAATITLTSNGRDIATLWPANAVLVALMLQYPRSTWKGLIASGFLANIAANVITRDSVTGPALYGVANMLEVYVVAWGLQTGIYSKGLLHRPESLWRFLFWAGMVGPAVSSILGALTAWLCFDQKFLSAMETWYCADALGLIVFIPFFYSIFNGDFIRSYKESNTYQKIELLTLQTLVLSTAYIVFHTSNLPILFLTPLPVMLVTFKRGWLGTQLSVVMVAVITTISTINNHGPIMLAQINHDSKIIFTQFYLATILIMHMPIAAALNSRMELIKRLTKSEGEVSMLAERAGILILNINRTGRLTKIVGAVERLIGKTEAELLGKGVEALGPEIGDKLFAAFREVMDYDSFDQALEFMSPNNPYRWLEGQFHVHEADRLANFEVVLTIQDISDRKRRERALVAKAHVDSMTGLLNRAGFTDKANRELAHAKEGDLFLAMVDIDRFKLINDNLGHAAGDAVLTAIASKMKSLFRSSDILGRLGGDEFAIVLNDISQDHALEACDRLVTSIAQTSIALPMGKSVDVSISCGIARWNSGNNLEQLKHNADLALYEAKRGGRNKAVAA